MDANRARRTAEYWSEAAGCPDTFLEHPLIQTYASLRAFGELRTFTETAIDEIRSRTQPGARLLSVGCGAAEKERQLAAALPDRVFVAMDIAPGALQLARDAAAADDVRNLQLEAGDFNDLQLEAASFDMILGLGSLHHIEALEAFWRECRKALRPGGCILAQEYVGPSRFQWTDAQIELGSALLRSLPAEHKVHHATVKRVNLDYLIAFDPSEAVRSADLIATCADAGFTLQVSGAGCGLLQPMLMHQMHTFEPRNWDHNHLLMQLFAAEDRAMQENGIGDAYAMFIAVPAPGR